MKKTAIDLRNDGSTAISVTIEPEVQHIESFLQFTPSIDPREQELVGR